MNTLSRTCFPPLPLSVALLALVTTSITLAETPSPERWEEEIAAFEQADRQRERQTVEVLFVGSSSIRMWNLEQAFPGTDLLNRGFGGSMMSDLRHFVDRVVIPYGPALIVMYEGDNDIAAGRTPEEVVEDYRSLTERIHAALPETRIVYLSIKPSVKRWALYGQMLRANREIQQIASEHAYLEYIDVSQVMWNEQQQPDAALFLDDGLHLNDEGYRRWSQLVQPYLTALKSAVSVDRSSE